MARHRAKFTLDAVDAFDPLTDQLAHSGAGNGTILGLQPDAGGEDGQWAIRAQYQLKW